MALKTLQNLVLSLVLVLMASVFNPSWAVSYAPVDIEVAAYGADDVALGDLDGDGDVDAYVVRYGTNRVWMNDGEGHFDESGIVFGTQNSNAVVLGDLDSDGDLDAVIANEQYSRIWMNDGAGVFEMVQALEFLPSRALALFDLEGDGDLDLVIGKDGANKVWLNAGNGSFSDSGQNLGSGQTNAVAFGDVDGDGDADIFAGNASMPGSEGSRVWFNNGTGTFTDSGQALGTAQTNAVALGDVDGDGDLDAYAANDNANTVWLNDGDGAFTDSGQALGTIRSMAVVLDDVDSDGDLDAYVGTQSADGLWLNDGSGSFSDSGQLLTRSDGNTLAMADLDGDGDRDAFVTNTVWLNDGAGTFIDTLQLLGATTTNSVDMGDVDGDGDMDALVGNGAGTYYGTNQVWLNDGTGDFTDSGQALGIYYASEVLLRDLDDDGDLDAFMNLLGRYNEVWLNDGAGEFTFTGQVLGNPPGTENLNHYSADIGDLDGDGDLDAFIGTNGDNFVWFNDGAAFFTKGTQRMAFDDTRGVALGDLDGDGDLDAYTGNNGDGNRIWLNNGSGTFADSGQALGANFSSTLERQTFVVALGDVDGDGDLDAWGGNHGRNHLWLNDGAANFTESGQFFPGGQTWSAALADMDEDGDLDVFVGNGNNGPANVLHLNDGMGAFSNSGQSLGSSLSYAVAVADVDGDGDMDAFVGNNTVNRLWRSVTGPTFVSQPPGEVLAGQFYDEVLNFTSETGSLTLSITAMPSWMTFDAATNRLYGTPGAMDATFTTIYIDADDGVVVDSFYFNLQVLPNQAPVFASVAPTTAMEATAYQYQVIITDDGDSTLAAVTIPAWLTFNANTGMLSGTPAAAHVGDHDVTLRVTDELQSVDQVFSIAVASNPNPPPPPPPPPPPTSSGGGGGSMGILLMFLAAIRVRRRMVATR